MNSILLYLFGVVAFVLAMLISIGLHELGHLIPAKKFGAKVSQYFVGFGPTVWSRQRGETEYGLKAYPLGGFVRIIGMLPPVKGHFEELRSKKDGTVDDEELKEKLVLRNTNTGLFTSLISSAKTTEYETIDPDDEERLFYKLPWYKKFIVMAGGPTVNVVLAFLCFLGIFMIYGVHKYETKPGSPIVASVAECAIPPSGTDAKSCSAKDKSPAFKAGLQVGDRIVALNGVPLNSWEELFSQIRSMGASAIVLKVERENETLELKTSPVELLRPSADGKMEKMGFLGISPKQQEVIEYGGVGYTLNYMVEKTVETFKILKQIPPKVKNVFLAILGVEDRDRDGPVSIVGGARFSGEVAAYDNSDAAIQINMEDKIASFFLLIGTFNLFVGIINFLPILPLDGGHLAGALLEGVKNGTARIFGRSKPAPVDISKMLPVAYAFGFALFLLGILLIIGDLVVPIKLFG